MPKYQVVRVQKCLKYLAEHVRVAMFEGNELRDAVLSSKLESVVKGVEDVQKHLDSRIERA